MSEVLKMINLIDKLFNAFQQQFLLSMYTIKIVKLDDSFFLSGL
jgi:hypothetical protein